MPFDLVAEVRWRRGRVRAKLEGVAENPVHALAGEHALLGDELPLGALEHPAADAGILALGVLAHDVEVDVRLGPAGERRARTRHQPARAQVHVLVEAAADRDQQPPQRHVVRHPRKSDRAEQDGVALAQAVEPVRRHHRASAVPGLARPVVVGVVEREAEPRGGRIQHADALGHGLLARCHRRGWRRCDSAASAAHARP